MISDIAAALVVVAGPFYPLISPLVGALGAFVTGSGTSTCVLFGGLQSQTALSLADEEPYKGKVFVVDNHRISVTQALAVLDAVSLAREGKTGEEIRNILEQQSLDATIYIAVDTLEYLKKG